MKLFCEVGSRTVHINLTRIPDHVKEEEVIVFIVSLYHVAIIGKNAAHCQVP